MLKKPSEHERGCTDRELLAIYRALPVLDQQSIFHDLVERGRESECISITESLKVLGDRETAAEIRTVAKCFGISTSKFTELMNPYRYSRLAARSGSCTIHRVTVTSNSRFSSGESTDIYVIAHQALRIEHKFVFEGFDLHVLGGSLSVTRKGIAEHASKSDVILIEAGEPIVITAQPGCRWIYVGHPLVEWLRSRMDAKPC